MNFIVRKTFFDLFTSNDKVEHAKYIQHQALDLLEQTKTEYDNILKLTSDELTMLNDEIHGIFSTFKTFSDTFEKIKNRPEFSKYENHSLVLPAAKNPDMPKNEFKMDKLINNILPALFGSMGVFWAKHRADQRMKEAGELEENVETTVSKIKKAEDFLLLLKKVSENYRRIITDIEKIYLNNLERFVYMVDTENRRDYFMYSDEEKKLVENTVLLVGLLFHMGRVELTKKSYDSDIPDINGDTVREQCKNVKKIIGNIE